MHQCKPTLHYILLPIFAQIQELSVNNRPKISHCKFLCKLKLLCLQHVWVCEACWDLAKKVERKHIGQTLDSCQFTTPRVQNLTIIFATSHRRPFTLQIWFNHVRVPREDMLDAFASVSPEGVYSSSIKSVGARFGTMVGGLTTGAATAGLSQEVREC